MPTPQKYNQSRRILQAYLFISSNGKVSLKEIFEYVFQDASDEERKAKTRYVQRLVDILVEEELVEKIKQSKHEGNLYKILEKRVDRQQAARSRGDETLAFYFVKAFMDQFKGTSLAKKRVRGYRNIDNFITMIHLIAGKLKFDYPL